MFKFLMSQNVVGVEPHVITNRIDKCNPLNFFWGGRWCLALFFLVLLCFSQFLGGVVVELPFSSLLQGGCCSLLPSLGVASLLRLPCGRWVLPFFEINQMEFLGGGVVLVVFLSVVVLSRGRCCFHLSCVCFLLILLLGAALLRLPSQNTVKTKYWIFK